MAQDEQVAERCGAGWNSPLGVRGTKYSMSVAGPGPGPDLLTIRTQASFTRLLPGSRQEQAA